MYDIATNRETFDGPKLLTAFEEYARGNVRPNTRIACTSNVLRQTVRDISYANVTGRNIIGTNVGR